MKRSALKKLSIYNSTEASSNSSKLVKIGEASRLLGVSIDTLRRWEKKGWLRTVKTPGGTRVYDRQQLIKLNPNLKRGPKSLLTAVVPVANKATLGNEIASANIQTSQFSTTNLSQTSSNLPKISLGTDKSVLDSKSSISQTELDDEIIESEQALNYAPNSFFSRSINSLRDLKSNLIAAAITVVFISVLIFPGLIITNYLKNTQSASVMADKYYNMPVISSAEVVKILAGIFTPTLSQRFLGILPPGSPPGAGLAQKLKNDFNPAATRDLGNLNGGSFSRSLGQVLAESTPSGNFLQINIDAELNGNLAVDGEGFFTGPITAPNLVYSLVAGENIEITGDLQNPTISATGLTESDTLQTVTGRGATTTVASTFSGGLTASSLNLTGTLNMGQLASDPSSAVNGATYYNTTSNTFRCYKNGSWQACDTDTTGSSFSGLVLGADSGTDEDLDDGDTITIAGSNGITTTVAATDTVTLALDVTTTSTTSTTTANSGLELTSAGLSLLRGCSNNNSLVWDSTDVQWECGTPSGLTNVEESDVDVGDINTLDFLGGDFDISVVSSEANIQLASVLTSVTGVAASFDVATSLVVGTGNAATITSAGEIQLPSTQTLQIGSIELNDVGSDNTTSGAVLIGAFDEFNNSSSTNLQDILDDFDAAIGGGASKWTQATGFAYLTNSTDDLVLGGTTVAGASLYFDESASNLYLGTNESANGILTLYSSGASITDPTLTTDSSGNLVIDSANFDVTSTGINNTAIGATTRSSAAFTTLAANSTVTFSSLSNGVAIITGGTGTVSSEAQLALTRGGTNKAITASAGAIVYSDSDSFELSAVGTSGQCLQSGGTGTPTWGACVSSALSPFTTSGGVITKTTAGDYLSLRYGDAADTQLEIENTTTSTIPAADSMIINLTGGTTGIVTDGVDGLFIGAEFGDEGTNQVNSGLHLDIDPVAIATSDDTFYALNIDGLSAGTSATETAINIGSNWDNFLNTPSIDISGAGAITGATGVSSSGTIAFSGLSTNGVVYTSGGTGTLNSEAQLALSRGGTNKNLTAVAGGIVYTDADSIEVSSAGTAGQAILSGGTGSPTFTTGTLTLAGNFATSGSSALTLTTTGSTNVTLPTTGTLITNTASANQTITSTQTSGTVFSIADSTALTGAITGQSISLTGSGAQDQTGLLITLSGASGSNLNALVVNNGTNNTATLSKNGVLSLGASSANTGQLVFRNSADTDTTTFQASTSQSQAAITYTLPVDDGDSNMVLTTDGSGLLSWQSTSGIGAGGDITAVGDITTGAAFTATAGADGTTLYFEGSTSDGNEIALTSADPGSDITVTLPNIAGTLASLAGTQTFTGAKSFTGGVTLGTASSNTGQLTFAHASHAFTNLFQSSGSQSQNNTYTLPVDDGSSNYVLATDGNGVLSWQSVSGVGAGTGDITAVGSMITGDAFADSSADNDWLGLGASAGRIEFDDLTIDEVNILSAFVGIGSQTPTAPLNVNNDTFTVTADASQAVVDISGALTEAGSGTHARLVGVSITAPTITAGVGAVTNTASLYIAGAPSASGATNYALWVDSGNVRFDGTIQAGSGNEVITLSTGKIDADAIGLISATNGASSTTSSASGLETVSDTLTLLQGCADSDTLAWNETSDIWQCSTPTTAVVTISEGATQYTGQNELNFNEYDFGVQDSGTVSIITTDYTNFGSRATPFNIGDSLAAGAAGEARTIDIGGVDVDLTNTIRIATNSTSADVITIGNSNASSTLALTGGDDWSITTAGLAIFAANVNANGGLDVDDAFVIADGGVLTTSQAANFNGGLDIDDIFVVADGGAVTANTDVTFTFAGAEDFAITSDLATAGTLNVQSIIGTPSSTDGTIRGLLIQQASSANSAGIDTGILLDNADDGLAITDGIKFTSSGGGAFTNFLETPSIDISGAGAISGATGITSSGTITFSGLSTAGVVLNSAAGVLSTTAQLSALRGGTGIDTSGSTGVPSISSGTWSVNTVLPLSLGGTNKNLTAVAGGVVYTDSDSIEVTSAGTSGQCLQSSGSSAPAWGACDNSATTPFTTSGGIIDKTTVGDRLRLLYGDAADVQLTIENTTNGTIPTADAMQIDLTGGTTGIITDGVDGLYIAAEFGNGTSSTRSALHLDVDPVNSPTSDDTFYGLNIDGLSSSSAVETAINIGAGWDKGLVIDAATTNSSLASSTGGIFQMNVDADPAAAGTNQGIYLDYETIDDGNADQTFRGFRIDYLNSSEDAADTTYALSIANANNTSGTAVATDALIHLDNADATADSLTDGIVITSSGVDAGITDAIDVSASNITNGLNLGGNYLLLNGIRAFSAASGDFTIEDTSGNDYFTFDDDGAMALGAATTTAITLTTDGTGNAEVVLPTGSISGTEILDDTVVLTTDTAGNYVASITNGSGISGGDGGSEGAALTLALSSLTADWNQTGAFDIILNNASSELRILESAGATYYGSLDVGDLGADKTYVLPNFTGSSTNICLESGNCSGLGGSIAGSGTAGEAAFFSASATIASENNFKWDSTNDVLSLGTGSAAQDTSALFDIFGESEYMVLRPADIASDADTNNSPLLRLRGTYDSDVAVGPFTSSNYNFDIKNTMTAAGASPASRLGFINHSGAEVMTVTSGGNVGIGDTSPDALLELLSTSEQLRLTHTDGTKDARLTLDTNGLLTIDTSTDGTVGGVFVNDDLYVGASTETIASGSFVLDGNDSFVSGMFGVEGNIFTDTGLNVADGGLVDLSSILHDDSAVQGLKLPQSTSLTAISGGTEGYLAYDTDDNLVKIFDGTNWTNISGASTTLQQAYDNDSGADDAIILMDATGSIIFQEIAGTNFQITATQAPTTDIMAISNSGQGTTTNGVDGLSVTFVTGDGSNPTNNGINVALTSGGGVSGDVLNGLNLSLSGTSGTERGINFADNNFDNDINALTDLTLAIGGTNQLTLTDGALSGTTDNDIDLGTSSSQYKNLYIEGDILADTALDIDIDNSVASVFTISEGTNNFLAISTDTDSISFGNASTNPTFSFLGTSAVTIAGSGDGTNALVLTLGDIEVTNGDLDVVAGDFNVGLDAADEVDITKTSTAAATEEGIDLTFTAGAGDGSDVYSGFRIAATSANHSASTDKLYGINIANLTSADAEGAESAMFVGTGWDDILNYNGTTVINGTGQIVGAQVTDDSLDFAQFQDEMDVDAATDINLGTFALTIDMDSTGDFSIRDGTTDILAFTDSGAITATPTSGQNFSVTTAGAGDILLNSGDTLLLDSAGVLELNSSAGAINIGNDAVAQAINIGTGAAARTITIGNATGATALAFTSGTGSQTFTSQVVSGTTTTSAFVFDATALTTGTGSYFTSDSITQGKLLQIATTGNTLTTGTLADIRTTSTALTGAAGTGSLLNLDWTPGSATTATGDLFSLNIGSNGTTTGKLFNILDSSSSIFSVSETAFETSLPSNFTSSGDLSIAYDIQLTNPVASFIKSNSALTIAAGEVYNSSNLTLQTYNDGSVYIPSNVATAYGVDVDANLLSTGRAVDISSTSTAGGASGSSYLLYLDRSGANSNATHTAYGISSVIANTGTTSVNVGGYFSATGATTNRGLEVAAMTGATSTGLTIGALSGTTADTGITIGAISGSGATGTGISIGNISTTGSANRGITLGTLTGGTATNYQINTGAVTAVASATNAQLNIGGVTGTAASSTNYGINIGTLDSTGTSNTGLRIGAVSGATSNYEIAFVGTSPEVAMGDGGTLTFSDGTNTLCQIIDGGSTGTLTCTGTGTLASDLQDAYDNSTTPATITLSSTDDSLVFTNPTSSGTDLGYLLHLNQAHTTGNVSALDITQASSGGDAVNLVANSIDTEFGIDISATGLTTGSAINVALTEATLNGGFYFRGYDNTAAAAVFTVGEDGNTTITGAEGSTMLTVTAGDTAISDGSLSITDDDDAVSLALTNNSAQTVGAGVNTSGVIDFSSTSLTTGNLLNLETTTTLTTGRVLNVSSTSTALTTGTLGRFSWEPGSSTTATSADLFQISIGSNGTLASGNLFNILDSGSSVFSVSETAFTTSLPSNFTSAGDVSIANDIQFTNPTASFIKSYSALNLVAGDTFGSSNLVGQVYNAGSIVFESGSSASTSTSGLVDINANSTTSNFIGLNLDITADSGVTASATLYGGMINVTQNDTDGLMVGLDINTPAQSTSGTVTALLQLRQNDTTTTGTTTLTNGMLIDSAASSGMTNGINIAGSAGTIANGLLIADGSGAITDGIELTGTFTNLFNAPNFDVNNAGNITVAAAEGLDTNGAGALELGFANATSIAFGASAASQLTLTDGVLAGTTDNDIDLGSSSSQFKDFYIQGDIIADTAMDIDIDDNIASAFTISQGTNNYFLATTSDGAEVVTLDLPAGNGGTGNLFTSNNTKTINIGTGTAADTINIGTGGTTADVITMGNTGVATTFTFNAGSTTSSTPVTFDLDTVTSITAFDMSLDGLTTGTGLLIDDGTAAGLSTGTLLHVNSVSTALAGTADSGDGLLGNFEWIPGSASTTGTGDLFRISIDANGTLTSGSLFNIVDSDSSIFSVKETSFTTSLPSNFTAAGDVSVAYDIVFTNPTASYIKSAAPLALVAGETFNSSDLTLQTYNFGSVVVDSVVSSGSGTKYNLRAIGGDSTSNANVNYGVYSDLDFTGNAAKVGSAVVGDMTSSSTTADTTIGVYGKNTVSAGYTNAAARLNYGVIGEVDLTAANSGSALAQVIYGGAFLANSTGAHSAGTLNVTGIQAIGGITSATSGSTNNVFAVLAGGDSETNTVAGTASLNYYGVHIENPSMNTTGTTAKYGLVIEDLGTNAADNNIGICFDCNDGTFGTASVANGIQWGGIAETTTQALRIFRSNGAAAAQITIEDAAGTDIMNGSATTFQINLSNADQGQGLCHGGADGAQDVQSIGDCAADAADFAEYFGSDGTLEAGDLVVLNGEATGITNRNGGYSPKSFVKKSGSSYQKEIIGIVSTNPYREVLNDRTFSESEHQVPIALSGQVPLKVSTMNGPIQKGDYLTSSSIPGVAMKATKPGPVVAQALQSYNSSGVGQIITFVNITYADPNDALASLLIGDDGSLLGGDINATKITVSGGITVGGLSSASDFALDASKLNLTTALASVSVDQFGKATLSDIVNTLADQTALNAQNLASLQDQQASQSAQLAEARILGEQAVQHAQTLDEKVASTSANLSSLSDRISDLLASISDDSNPSTPSAAPSPSDLDLTPPDLLLATSSATLANLDVTENLSTLRLSTLDATVSATFKSLGETFLGQTTIAGDLTVDGTLSFTNGNSINAFPILYFQNNPLAQAVDFFNGLVTITKDGVLTAKEIITDQIKVTANKSAGEVTIPAGETEIPVLNELVKTDSIIILTSQTPGAPNLAVGAKVEDSGFIVNLNNPYLDDVKFNYLIIGQN